MDVDISGSRESLSGYLRRELGSDRILIDEDYSKANPARFPQSVNQTTTVYPEPATAKDQGGKDKRNQQRDIYHPTPIQKTDPRLDVPGKTLSKNGVADERTRKPTIFVNSTVSQRIQRTNRESIQQVQTGYEAVRGAEQAATTSGERLEQTSNSIEAANQQLNQLHRQVHRDFERGRRALERKRKEELEKFKTEINLVEYAFCQGYQYRSQASSRNSAVLRHDNGDKIVVTTDTDGHGIYFSVRDEADNGTIIDFIQNRNNLTLGEVRKELRNWRDEPRTRSSKFIPRDKPQPINSDLLKVIKAASGFRVAYEHPYLEKRSIERATLTSARFVGTVAIDGRGNAIFPHYDQNGLTGYSIKNTKFTGFSSGGTKALWKSNQQKGDLRLVITESAIDALSYHQLFSHENTNTRYIATGGAISNYQRELISTAMADMATKGGEIVIATDNDEIGNKLAKTLFDVAPESSKVYRYVPKVGKDWNEVLQRERRQELARQKQQRSRGLGL